MILQDRINTPAPTASTAPAGAARIARISRGRGRDVNAMQDYYLPGVLAEELLVAADFGDALRVKALIEKGAATLPDQLRGGLVPRSPSCVSDRCRCDGPRRLERLYGATSRRELGTRRAAPRPALVCCAGRSRQRSGLRRPDATPPRRAGTCHAAMHVPIVWHATAVCAPHACAPHA